jgi:hypothetical protein
MSASPRPIFIKICTFSLTVNPGPYPFILKDKIYLYFRTYLKITTKKKKVNAKPRYSNKDRNLSARLCNSTMIADEISFNETD